jgi:protein phosphatase PTC7
VTYAHQLALGDVIVVGSDGLWDNLHPSELLELVNRHSPNEKELAESIAKAAYKRSLSTNYSSPFHEKAKKARLYYPQQGKSDDITVVAATVIS